jgi:hypothetical protein
VTIKASMVNWEKRSIRRGKRGETTLADVHGCSVFIVWIVERDSSRGVSKF